MNWLTPAFAFIAAVSFFMTYRIRHLDSRASLNRKLMAGCYLVGFYELAISLTVAAPNPSWFYPCLIASSSFYLLIGPVVIAALLDFAGVRDKWAYILNTPCVIMTIAQLVQVWTGSWVITGYHYSAWGNVSELTHDPLNLTLNRLYSFIESAIGLTALIMAWFHSSSPRYRLITVGITGLSILVNLWGLFATAVIWLSWGLPDPTGLGAGIIFVGYSILIERYHHLSERKPDFADSLLSSLTGTALFIDTRGVVYRAPKGASLLLGNDIEGKPLATVLKSWKTIGQEWESLKSDLKPRRDLEGTIGGGRFLVSLIPHHNPFGIFDGALVRIVPEEPLDEAGAMYALTAREWDVARLVCEGSDTAEIAKALFISLATVKNHLHNLYIKTGTTGRADLVRALLSKSPGKAKSANEQ